MQADYFAFFQNDVFKHVVQALALVILAATVATLAFTANELTRRSASPTSEVDLNWRFLFTCWRDSMLITLLWAASSFVYLFKDSMEFTHLASYRTQDMAETIRAGFVIWSVQVVIHVFILIIAIRLVLKIGKFLGSKASSSS